MLKVLPKFIIFSLLLLGAVVIGLRISLLSNEAVPVGDQVWQINMAVTVNYSQEKSNLRIAVPLDSSHIRIISQSYEHPGFHLKRISLKQKNQKEIIAEPTQTGELTFAAEYRLQISQSKRWQQWLETSGTLTPEMRQRYLEQSTDAENINSAISNALTEIRSMADSQEELLNQTFKFVHQRIINDPNSQFTNIERTAKARRGNPLAKAHLMVNLCRENKIPSRLVTGIVVSEMLDLHEHYWVEANINDQWIAYDPTSGYIADLPANYFTLKIGSDLLAYLDDGTPLDIIIDSIQVPAASGMLGTGKKRLFDILDFNRLPVNTQFLLATLFLLPFGALITTFFRQILGVQTYGTFTPALLAMSIIHAEWLTVIVVVLIVVAVGFGGRSILPEKMSRTPRLSIILTIVAIGMGFSISILEYFQLNPDPTVILLPIIVLTNLVDRFYSTAEDKSFASAVYRLIWTFIVTAVCFFLFVIEPVQLLVLAYPEIHFFTLAAILLISGYKGKTLASLPYWHWLKEPTLKHQAKPKEKRAGF